MSLKTIHVGDNRAQVSEEIKSIHEDLLPEKDYLFRYPYLAMIRETGNALHVTVYDLSDGCLRTTSLLSPSA